MDKAQIIKTSAEEMLKKMIDTFEIEIQEEEGMYQVIIKAEEEAPTIIGRHGETIRAIQKILEVMLYKQLGEPVNLLVNVNDYREKQKARLQELASQMASRTQETKELSYMRGLSSFERKLIHEYITNTYPELTTYSEGEGRDRKLVIDVKKETEEKVAEEEK